MVVEELSLEQLLDKYNSIIEKRCSIKNNIIVHYTSPDGLKGIIENKTLRFTDSKYLNDKSEGQIIYDVIDNCLDEQKYNKNFVEDVKDILIRKLSPSEQFRKMADNPCYKYRYFESKHTAFLCCFSFNDDSLAMWNYYTKNQNSIGFNLSFNKVNLMSKLRNVNSFAYLTAMPVVYDDENQNEIIKTILDDFYEMWNKTQKNKEAVIEYLADLIDSLKFCFKHNSFKHEEEFRIILYIYNKDAKKMLQNKDIKLQIRNGVFTPYIDVECIFETNLKQIMISPTSHDEIVTDGVHNLLNYCNFKGVLVKKSDSPSRY